MARFERGDVVMWVAHRHIKNDIPDGSVGTIVHNPPSPGFRTVRFWINPDRTYILPTRQLKACDV